MADKELTRLLADLVRANAQRGPQPNFNQVSGLSKAILSGVGLQKPYQANPQNNQPDGRGPSFVNRVLDIMSRPLYSVLNPVKKELEENRGKSPFEQITSATSLLSPVANLDDMWEGFTGREKTTGKDLIKATGYADQIPKPVQFGAGLAIDIAADPLNMIGLGSIRNLGKAARGSTEALNAVEEGTQQTAQNLSQEISRRAAEQSQKLNITVPEKGMPAPDIGAPPRIFEAGPGPTVTSPELSKTPKSGVSADDLLEYHYQQGNLIRGTADELKSKIDALRGPGGNLPPLGTRQTPLALPAGSQVPQTSPLDVLEETLSRGRSGRSELSNLIQKLPQNADPLTTLKVLNEQINSVKSPIAKNLLRKEAEKIQAGVKPADILSEARVTPPPFPDLTIGQRWIDTAIQAAQSFLKNNPAKNIHHIGQSNLYNKILNAASKVRKDRRQFHVLQMLRIAEEEVLKAGRHLTDAEGISVRLSDIANISGGARALTSRLVDDFRKARPSQQIEDLKAFTTPQVASDILDPVIKTGADIAETIKELPPSQTVLIGSQISKELSKLSELAGASSREAKTAKAFIDDLFNPSKDQLYTAVAQQARNLVRQTSEGIINPQTLHKISEETYKALGANPKILGRQVQQNKVTEGIMTKFATWWGAKDLKPFSREYIDTARNVAGAFAETMTPLVRHTTPTQRSIAWSIAQGKISAPSVADAQLADQFKYLVERLMGTHGITDNAEAVIYRSGTLMKELNEELPKALRLIDKKGTDKVGKTYDYTKGQWMNSWKEWDVKEPAEALYQLTRALQLVTRKNAMWDDAATRWGMPIKGAEFQHQATGIDRLKGTYFPEQIATQLTNLQRQLERDIFKVPHKAIGIFDQVQRMWKTGVTIYSPSHHIRNLNGDIYLAALDGVVSARPYSIATKVLHAYPTRYNELESVFNIMDPKLRESALRSRPGNVVLTTKRGDKLTAQQLYQAAESQGLFIRAMHIEDLMGDAAPAFGTFGAKFQPFGGRVYGAATRVSELRDHWVRLAHFIDIIGKSRQPLRIAIEQAGRRVKKFHPDGMDLTGFEQNVLRRVIPFYSWMRKATPLVLEGALMRPHITLAFPKVMANMQTLTGIESEGPGDPFPMDQMFPEWLKEKGVGPVLQPGSGIGRDASWRGESPGYTIINPTQPFMDQISQIGNPQQTALSSLTPAARIPLELLTGQTSLGIPLENVEGGVPGHLAQQIPPVGIGARITGMTRDNEPYNPEQLINWLTSAGITGTGPYQSQAQQELRQALANLAKQQRGDYR